MVKRRHIELALVVMIAAGLGAQIGVFASWLMFR
jgi:hypothetical protein